MPNPSSISRVSGANRAPVVLCIAGFDPSGGAGLLADTRACRAFGAFAVCAQTALVIQNSQGVRAVHASAPDVLKSQLETLVDDSAIGAVKVGMLPDLEALEAILPTLQILVNSGVPLVVDPVLAPSSGPRFVDEALLEALRTKLFPLATLVTPNAPEAARLCDLEVNNAPSAELAARSLMTRWGARAVLLKGGHLAPRVDERRGAVKLMETNVNEFVVDWFFDGFEVRELRAARVEGVEVRGTGCLLASAIAAQLARDVALLDAARAAKNWLAGQIGNAQQLGRGRRVAVF